MSLDKHFTACIGLINISERHTLKSNEPVNKCIQVQRHFYSTKRKRVKTSVRKAKPNRDERNDVIQSLLKEPAQQKNTGVPREILGRLKSGQHI